MKDTKYLTQMKKLPPETEEEAATKSKSERGDEENLSEKKKLPRKDAEKIGNEDVKVKVPDGFDEDSSDMEDSEGRSILSSKDVILGIINLISIGLLIFILFQFPKKAEELRKLRTEEFLNESSVAFEFTEVEKSLEKANTLQGLFLEESGLVDFVNEAEKIRSEESALKKVAFASQQSVKDRTGNFGIPVVIELTGTWEAIDRDLQKIDKLPFLFRAANISIEPSETDPGVLVFKYGLFLYVDDKKIAQ